MGTYTGTDSDDEIRPGYLSPGVTADPPGTTPSVFADILWGLDGDDTLSGGEGNDTLYGDGWEYYDGMSGRDTLDGGDGDDVLYGGQGSDSLYGGAGNDVLNPFLAYRELDIFYPGLVEVLHGGDGDDELHDGPGDDTLYGDAGNDVLIGSLDFYDWNADFGRDGNDVFYGGDGDDSLIVSGVGRALLFGGAGNDELIASSSGADVLDGGPGADTMRSWDGNDDFYVDDPGDVVEEVITDESGGNDDVFAFVSFTLGAGLENLLLQGEADLSGIGNDLNNDLVGNGGHNVLSGLVGGDDLFGRAGADVLRGGKGRDDLDGGMGQDRLAGGKANDDFIFAAPMESGDTITDFHSRKGNNDRIVIEASGFKGGLDAGGQVAREQFQISGGYNAESGKIRFLFDSRDQSLWFDRNGDRSGGLTLIADLQASAELTHQDIFLI